MKANYSIWDVFYFISWAGIEKHTVAGHFLLKEEISYIFTPYGKVQTLKEAGMYRTFEDAKVALVKQWNEVLTNATAQLKGIEGITEKENVILHPSEAPTEKEMKDDEAQMAAKSMPKEEAQKQG